MSEIPLESVARALGRRVSDIEAQIDAAEHPKAERLKLERKAERKRREVEDREEQRWLDEQAEQSRQAFLALRGAQDGELQQRRQQRTIGAQLDQALAEAALLTGVEAGNSEGNGGGHSGKMEGRGPGRISGALYENAQDVGVRYRAVIGQLISNLHREIDSTIRRPLDRKLESSGEKEARLFEHWKGVRSEVVATLDPPLGGARSIEMMRRRHGLRPVDGTSELPRKSAAGPQP